MKNVSIKENFIYTICYEILVIILPILTSPYVSRVLGAESIGIYSYTFSISNYFVMFSMLGLVNYGNRVIAQNRDDRLKLSEKFWNLYTIHALVSVLVLVCYVAYYFMTENAERIYILVQGLYIVATFFNIDWFFFGIEEFKITVTRNFVVKIVTASCIFIFVKEREDLLLYILILALGNLGGNLSVWGYLKKYILVVKPSVKEMRVHIKPLFVLFIPTISISIYKVMDKIMLGYMCDKVQVGFYENSEKMISIPMTVITAFGNVMKPRITYMRNKGFREKAEEYTEASMKYIMMLAYALAFGIISIGDIFAPVFWGEEFKVCGELISLLAVCIPFLSFANVIRTQYLLPESKDSLYNITLIFGAISNLVANSLCIPIWGAKGAAYGTIIAEAVVCLMQVYFTREVFPAAKYFVGSGFFFVFGFLMYVVLSVIKCILGASVMALIILIVIGIFLYSGMCLFYMIVTKDKYFFDLLKGHRNMW